MADEGDASRIPAMLIRRSTRRVNVPFLYSVKSWWVTSRIRAIRSSRLGLAVQASTRWGVRDQPIPTATTVACAPDPSFYAQEVVCTATVVSTFGALVPVGDQQWPGAGHGVGVDGRVEPQPLERRDQLLRQVGVEVRAGVRPLALRADGHPAGEVGDERPVVQRARGPGHGGSTTRVGGGRCHHDEIVAVGGRPCNGRRSRRPARSDGTPPPPTWEVT